MSLTVQEVEAVAEFMQRMENKEPGLYRRFIGNRLLLVDYDRLPKLSEVHVLLQGEKYRMLDSSGSIHLYIDKEYDFNE